jgi:membrane dipeptidase
LTTAPDPAPLIVVDAHQDIAYNAVTFGRDYRLSALKKRRVEAERQPMPPPATLGLPEALVGRVAVVFATLFVAPDGASPSGWPEATYATPRGAHDLALAQYDVYQRLADETPNLSLVRDAAELDAVLATWTPEADLRARRQGLVLLMEGADPILEPRQFEEWYARGVRIVGPAWSETRYAAGTGKPGRLSPLGRELLEVMRAFDAVLDLSHLAEEAYLEALEMYDGPVIASHSNPRRFRDTDRHLSDAMIRLLAQRDGVMGIVPYNRFLSARWSSGDPKSKVPLGIVADAIDHVCQLTGSAAHVGLGSDFDGGFGADSIPDELDTVADLIRLADVLRARGYSEADVAAVMGGNMLRVLRAALP